MKLMMHEVKLICLCLLSEQDFAFHVVLSCRLFGAVYCFIDLEGRYTNA